MNTLKNIIGIIAFLLIGFVAVAQNTTIQFVGKDRTGNDYVRLNHVSVFDEDQLWHEMLYYPDTTLFLGPVSVEDYAMQDFRLMQNVPNPFEGITDIALSLPDVRDVTLEIYDMLGKVLVKQSFPSLQEGTHLFRASMTSPQTYLLSATTKDGKTSIKMVNEGVAAANNIEYIGMTTSQGGLSLFLDESKGAGSYPFNIGDKMKYTGYALIDNEMRTSETIQKKQYNNETIQLKFDVERPVVETKSCYSLSAEAACFNAEVTSDNNASVTERGFCYATHNSPTLNDSWISVGTGVGSFTANVTDLTAGTVYYVRAYAINAIGLSYGSSKSIRTHDTIPEVTTTVPSQITAISFVSGGNVLTDNGAAVTVRGVCWSTSPNPTIADNHTSNGSGLGSYTSSIGDLECGTTYYVRAYATNSVGTAYGDTYSVTTLSTGIPEVTTNIVSDISSNSAICGGVVTHDGCDTVTARGVCWSTSQNPTVSDSHTTDGGGTGSFTSNITGLTAGTVYYVRAYATNSVGTSYGNQITFTTLAAPTVTTNTVSNITSTSATCGGYVTSTGGATVTARGVCWSTSQNPTISDSHTTNGSGMGSFTSNMTGLAAGTTYYVRAYATNSVETSYGEQRSFTTLAVAPTLTTNTVSNITSTSATCGGNVTSDGGATVTVRGVCWSTSQNPTVSNSHTSNGSGTGSFTSNITGLTPGTTYYVRAYATNSAGTGYGPQRSFTTTVADGQPCPGAAIVTDYDNNTYNTVKIGDQCWMKENLRTTHYSNGTSIALGSSTSTSTAYRYYPNNSSSNVSTYGYLYNWKAVMRNSSSSSANPSGVQGICPTGWHVPSDAEWTQLTNYVGSQPQYQCGSSSSNIGKALASTTGWSSSTETCAVGNNTSTNNATGFSALPAGYYDSGNYYHFGYNALFWSATEYNDNGAYNRYLFYNYADVHRGYYYKYFGFSVRCVKDADGNTATVPTVTTTSVTSITANSATCGGNVTSDGGATVTARGVCWSTSQNPTVSNSHTSNGSGTGSFTSSITGLTAGTTYYVRAYATNSVGTSYGEQRVFTTLAVAPTLTTNTVSNITSTSATCGGNVTNDGGATVTARGVCWSTSQNPTVSNSHTSNGSGTGSFTSSITGLTAGTTYYVRAYATNSVGTAYGSQVSFTTTSSSGADGQPCPGATTVTDYDNNTYNTVQIGNQCWMKENLRTTRYSSGTSIALVPSTSYSTTTSYRYYPNDDANNVLTYGYLYNWPAVMNGTSSSSANPSGVQGICPTGWHVPSDAEWTQLTNYVSSQSQYQCGSSSSNIAKALASTTGWISYNITCAVGNNPSTNNATGFSALPAGISDNADEFGWAAHFWSATDWNWEFAYEHYLRSNEAILSHGSEYKSYGSSVRCVKDVGGNIIPTVTTNTVSNITSTTATCGGNVTNDGGATVTARGVCWSTSQNPTVSNSHTSNGSGTGSFTSSITGLTAGTTYYVRAYATNSVGTAYGSQVSFTTTSSSGADGQPCPGAATVTDYDNNTYNTVKIGNQCWMKENLRTTHYSNGTSIALGSSTSTSTAYRYYPNNSSSNVSTYGYLYNWKAVMRNSSSSSANPSGVQGICPTGWHVPSGAEWTQLINYVISQSQYQCGSSSSYIAKALASTTGWNSSTNTCDVGNNPSTNNATGFSALPAGSYSGNSGSYYGFGYFADFWSATENNDDNAYYRNLHYADALLILGSGLKYAGISVRCVRD